MNSSPDKGQALLDALAGNGPIMTPVALVVAHQDDEAIAAAGTLVRFRALTLIHLTDGATSPSAPFSQPGFSNRDEYAQTRARELDRALQACLAVPQRQICYQLPDQTVGEAIGTLTKRLAADLLAVDAVITHPYEGGHMDHDAAARAVALACALLARATGRAPARLEFAGYHRIGNDVRTGEFWPDPACPAVKITLSPSARRRREAAFECFTSQRDNLRYFSTLGESFRIAPDYDFTQAPPTRR